MATLLTFRNSEHTGSPSATTSRNRRSSSSRSSALRSAKGIDGFDLSNLLNNLPPNTGHMGQTAATSNSNILLMANKNLSHVPCKFFKQGICQAGKSCPFSHNLDGTLSADKLPCKYFQKGNCKFGSKCALAHISSDGTRLNPKLSFRRGGERHENHHGGANKIGSFHVFHSPGTIKELDFLTEILDKQERYPSAQSYPDLEEYGSPPEFISVSTSAFLRDSNYHTLDAFGTHQGQDISLSMGIGEWLSGPSSMVIPSQTAKSSLRQSSEMPLSTSMGSSQSLLVSKISSPASDLKPCSLTQQSPSRSETRKQSLSHHWTSKSPLFDLGNKSLGDFAIVDDEEDSDSEDTYYEDYIPASLGNLIFTPQEKKRRDSRSQSGTLLVRPDIYLDSLVETSV